MSRAIPDHDARIRSLLEAPAIQRLGSVYAVMFVGFGPDVAMDELLAGFPHDWFHMHEATEDSMLLIFTLGNNYIEQINSIDHSQVSSHAQMIIYKVPGQSDWTTRLRDFKPE